MCCRLNDVGSGDGDDGGGGGGGREVSDSRGLPPFSSFPHSDSDSSWQWTSAAVERELLAGEADAIPPSASSSSSGAVSAQSDVETKTATASSSAPCVGTVVRHYLYKEPCVRGHAIWYSDGFWDAALLEGISAEMANMDPILWDELGPEPLREAVIGVHNIVFGQLAAIARMMLELGLSGDTVLRFVTSMSKTSQLTEDQEIELRKSVYMWQHQTKNDLN